MADDKVKDLNALAEDVKLAQEIHMEAKLAVQRAHTKETQALNSLNEAQKAFDAAIANMRDGASVESDWRRAK